MKIDDTFYQGPPANLPSAEGLNRKVDGGKLKKACAEFESLFLERMFKIMRQSIPNSEFLGSGLNPELYQSLFDQELSKNLALKGGIGLGKILYQKIKRTAAHFPDQESVAPPTLDKYGPILRESK